MLSHKPILKRLFQPAQVMITLTSGLVAYIAFFAAYRPISYARHYGFDFPLGPDPTLWGKAAVLARFDSPQTLPPAFPKLTSVLAGSDSLVQGALYTNSLSLGFAVIFAALGSAALGTHWLSSCMAALCAAVMVGLCSSVFPVIYYFQPDLMTFSALTAFAAAGAMLSRRQNKWSILCFGFAAGVCFSTREHGIVIALSALLAIGCALKKGRRLISILVFAFGLQVGGSVAAGQPTKPFFWPHGSPNGTIIKASVAFRDSMSMAQNNTQNQPLSGGLQRDRASDKPYLESMREQALTEGRDFLPLFAMSLLSLGALAYSRHWRATVWMGAALAPLVASLLFWTQWRHFFVVSGAGVVVAVGGLAALLGRKSPLVGTLGMGFAVGAYASVWIPYQSKQSVMQLKRLVSDQSSKSGEVELASKIRALALPGSVVQASDTVAILAGLQPMVFKASELTAHDLPPYPSFTYRAYIVERQSPGPIWEAVDSVGSLSIYQAIRPKGVDMKCLYGIRPEKVVEKIPDDKERLQPKPAKGCP